MEVTYYIEDGYAGKNRPQHVNIDDDELRECETVEEKIELISNAIGEHFEQNICWYCDFERFIEEAE